MVSMTPRPPGVSPTLAAAIPRAVREDQTLPGHVDANRPHREREAQAVGNPVPHSQGEDFRVLKPRQAQARNAIDKPIKRRRGFGAGPAKEFARQRDEARDEAVESSAHAAALEGSEQRESEEQRDRRGDESDGHRGGAARRDRAAGQHQGERK
jgi:hypothetical protein